MRPQGQALPVIAVRANRGCRPALLCFLVCYRMLANSGSRVSQCTSRKTITSCSYLRYPAAGGVGPTAEETATPGASGPFHIARCLRMRFGAFRGTE